jgi:hypothetical protein
MKDIKKPNLAGSGGACLSVIPALGRLRQEIMNLRLACAT